MRTTIPLLTALAVSLAHAQRTTYTGCHNDSENGAEVEYCFGPDGVESARATYAVSGTATLPASAPASATGAAQTTAVTACRRQDAAVLCTNGANAEVRVEATPTGPIPAQYTGCHSHGAEQFCVDSDGEDVRVAAVTAGSITPTPTVAEGQTTAVTACHSHETEIYCINGAGSEVLVEATMTEPLPAAYTGCHAHGADLYCLDPAGEEVMVRAEGATSPEAAGAEDGEENQHCHFHAGVEHCTGGSEGEVSCGLREREYNVGLRVGTLFVILITSAIGVFAPILLREIPRLGNSRVSLTILTMVKQFGTGIIIATAFIHLYTHAELMFSNECIGELGYEGTTSAIVIAGISLSFLVEYLGLRLVAARTPKTDQPPSESPSPAQSHHHQSPEKPSPPPAAPSSSTSSEQPSRTAFLIVDHHHGGANTRLSVAVMEAGILFHSTLIGLTLVVAGDSFYRTLLVVIVFHQFFEGVALGARIALLPGPAFPAKFLMAVAFALVTPFGMAVGIAVLRRFNGNNPATVIAFGVLDALSAGILVWVGVVDMWARDWVIEGGEMLDSGVVKTLGAGASLVCGLVLMGVLGKWA